MRRMCYTCCEYATKEVIHMHTNALTHYLHQEISPADLSDLLDQHLETMFQRSGRAGEAITEEQASVN